MRAPPVAVCERQKPKLLPESETRKAAPKPVVAHRNGSIDCVLEKRGATTIWAACVRVAAAGHAAWACCVTYVEVTVYVMCLQIELSFAPFCQAERKADNAALRVEELRRATNERDTV